MRKHFAGWLRAGVGDGLANREDDFLEQRIVVTAQASKGLLDRQFDIERDKPAANSKKRGRLILAVCSMVSFPCSCQTAARCSREYLPRTNGSAVCIPTLTRFPLGRFADFREISIPTCSYLLIDNWQRDWGPNRCC